MNSKNLRANIKKLSIDDCKSVSGGYECVIFKRYDKHYRAVFMSKKEVKYLSRECSYPVFWKKKWKKALWRDGLAQGDEATSLYDVFNNASTMVYALKQADFRGNDWDTARIIVEE